LIFIPTQWTSWWISIAIIQVTNQELWTSIQWMEGWYSTKKYTSILASIIWP